MSHFGLFCTILGMFWGSLWGQLGIVLASFWGRFEIVLRSFWLHFGGFLGHFWVFLRSFCAFLVVYWHFQSKNEQTEAIERKNKRFSGKNWPKNGHSLCKNKPSYAYETLVSLKIRSKSTFQPMKAWTRWVCLQVSWMDFECFYAILWRSSWVLNGCFGYFWPFLTPLSHFWPYLRLHRALLGYFGTKLETFWCDFGVISDHFWLDTGHFGVT